MLTHRDGPISGKARASALVALPRAPFCFLSSPPGFDPEVLLHSCQPRRLNLVHSTPTPQLGYVWTEGTLRATMLPFIWNSNSFWWLELPQLCPACQIGHALAAVAHPTVPEPSTPGILQGTRQLPRWSQPLWPISFSPAFTEPCYTDLAVRKPKTDVMLSLHHLKKRLVINSLLKERTGPKVWAQLHPQAY